MAIIRLNNNRLYPRPARATATEQRRPRWLMPAAYAGVFLLIILALVFIARSQGSTDKYAMFVTNGTGGMAQLGSSVGQSLNQSSPNMGNAVANIAASAADEPGGSPTDPTRGQPAIVHDYAATGGPGNTGALDIAVSGAMASPIHATHDGLIKTLRNNATYGNLVYVIGTGYTTIYGHLQNIAVSDGQMVKRGDVIGTLGSSGATSVYLNYQVWQCQGDPQASGTAGRTCVNKNPADYLK